MRQPNNGLLSYCSPVLRVRKLERPGVGRETVHVHSEAVHVHVHEDTN